MTEARSQANERSEHDFQARNSVICWFTRYCICFSPLSPYPLLMSYEGYQFTTVPNKQ